MYENELSEKLKNIFQLKKVTFQEPGESNEQETLFIEIETSRNKIKDGRFTARVSGRLTVFGNANKMPFGFFSKQIDKAKVDDKKDFFFTDFEENTKIINNIVERSLSFVYFFNGQFDPNIGTLNQIDIEET